MKKRILAAAALFLVHAAVHASTFSISSSTSGTTTRFIVTRDDATAEETVKYRTVGLSAYAGQHFTEKSGTLTFPTGQTAVTNTVTEKTPSADAYRFQTGSNRSYRFELTDKGGLPPQRLRRPRHRHRHERAFERRVQRQGRDDPERRVHG